MSQIDESFEPIAVVTPPAKKRQKTNDYDIYNQLSMDYNANRRLLNPLNSLQYLDFANSDHDYSSFQGMSSSTAPGNSFSPYPRHSSTALRSPLRGMTQLSSSPLRQSVLNSTLDAVALNALSERTMMEEFDPLFTDMLSQSSASLNNLINPSHSPRRNSNFKFNRNYNSNYNSIYNTEPEPIHSPDNNDVGCPDLCNSSSSLPDEGGFIIQSSDSFKENDYAKAEIVSGETAANQLELPLNYMDGQILLSLAADGLIDRGLADRAAADRAAADRGLAGRAAADRLTAAERLTADRAGPTPSPAPTGTSDTYSSRGNSNGTETPPTCTETPCVPSATKTTKTARTPRTPSSARTPKTIIAPRTPSKPSTSSNENEKEAQPRFKPFHEEKWTYHYGELLTYKEENGHCLVPHTYPSKPHLARWVKRQRRQYKLRLEGNPNSTMTAERIQILNDIGFVWDSHEVIWNERYAQLLAYKSKFGHCRVPSYCKECPQLASWVKCQRRQYKLFWEQGKGSSMSLDRIKLLNSIGFIWEVHPGRKRKENEQHFQHIANILMDG
jgi:hypothetical protein